MKLSRFFTRPVELVRVRPEVKRVSVTLKGIKRRKESRLFRCQSVHRHRSLSGLKLFSGRTGNSIFSNRNGYLRIRIF